jgi:hypothetical protein
MVTPSRKALAQQRQLEKNVRIWNSIVPQVDFENARAGAAAACD